MSTKHTPPPWDDIDLMDLLSKPTEELEANIALMNAAPEMLEALIYYKNGIDHFYKCIDFASSFLDAEAITFMNTAGLQINAAIKKATP